MDGLREIIGTVIIFTGLIFMFFGVIGIYKFKTFYTRLLATSKTDTVGAISIIIGVSIINGFSFFTAKVILIALIMLVFNPLIAHTMARSAYLSEKENDEEGTP